MKFALFLTLLAAFVVDTLFPGRFAGFAGLTVTNAALFIGALILVVTEVANGTLSRKNMIGVVPAVTILAAVILGLVYARLIGIVQEPLIDHLRSAKSFVAEPVLLYGMAFLLVSTRAQGERYLMSLVVVLGALNLVSVVAAQFGLEIYRVADVYVADDDGSRRLSGFTGNPNKTAYLTCVLVTFQYYFYKFHRSWIVKIAMAALMVGGLIVVLLTGSRGGLLVLMVVVMGLAYRLRDMRVIYAAVVMVPLVIVALLATGSTLLENAFNRIAMLSSGDVGQLMTGRDQIWSMLLSDYAASALGIAFGNGYGAAQYMGARAEPHNMYLKVLVEFGIVGLAFFVYFIFAMFRRIAALKLGVSEALKSSVLAGGSVVTVAWFFTTLVGILDLIWFTLGIATATLVAAAGEQRAPEPTDAPTNLIQKPARILSRKPPGAVRQMET